MEHLGQSDWLKGRKHLIDPEYLSPIKTTAGKARAFVKKHALPFPINGLQLVPKDSISYIESNLLEYEHMFSSDVRRLLSVFDDAVANARMVLGDLFDPLDYPQDLKSRFGFSWQYVQLSLPGQHSVLSPELYQREKDKFIELMDRTRQEAVLALRQEFSELVGNLSDRLTSSGRPRVLRSSMLDKMNEFLEGFKNRNVFADDQLQELVDNARQVINTVDIQSLKSDESLRESIQQSMESIKDEVDRAIEDAPRRKIVLKEAV
jgi:hypothetical protein